MERVRVAVFGAGRMGSEIGCEYALAGHDVVWVDRSPEPARERIGEALRVAADAGLGDGLDQAGIVVLDDAAGLTGTVDIVVESVKEDFDTKVALLRPLVGAWPEAVFATNTSSLSISELGNAIGAPERTIGTHYWNPPLLMPLVEVIRGERTDDSVVEQVVVLLTAIGKHPVLVQRDVHGFIGNRLQFAVLREALWIVQNGVASAEAVDDVMRVALARRWRYTGPFATVALGGVETFSAVAATLFPLLSTAQDGDDLARWIPTDAERLATLAEHRDRALASEIGSDDRPEQAGA